MKFSPSTNGFYIEAIHGTNIPGDAKNITDEEYAALLSGQSAGKRIAADANGIPCLQNAPNDEQRSITALQGLLAIDQAGLSATYEAWANDPARTFAQRAFIDKAQTWRRDDATLAAAATEFGLSGDQVDGLFALAATL